MKKKFKNKDKKIVEENDISKIPKKSVIAWPIGIIGIVVILLNLISIVSPGLIVSLTDNNEFLELFEIGAMGIPLLITNIIIFSFFILHFKHFLPESFENKIRKILSYDISYKNSLVLLIIILAIYVSISANELTINEMKQYGDFGILLGAIEIWPDGESNNKWIAEQLSRYVRMALLVASNEIFDNLKFLPFIASISILIVTYFLTKKLSRKNISGLLAVILIIQSPTFHKYDTIAVYENFWVLFYVFSIYLIYVNPKISSPFYLLSIFSKAITVLMLPISIIITLLSDIPKKEKNFVIITHVIVIIISLMIFQFSNSIYGDVIDLDISEFLIGFTSLAFNLRFDVFLLLFLLPVIFGLFIKAKNGNKNSISLIILICGTILITPVLNMITDFYLTFPYRYVPLIVFFSIGASSLLSKK